MTMAVPYLRDVELVVGVGDARLELRDLYIKFGIRWEADATGATGDIEVFNLGDATEARIRRRGERVILYAGYRDIGLEQIAFGDVRRVERRRSGADRITVIRFGGSVQSVSNAVFTQSYEAAVSLRDVITDVVATMDDVDIGDISAIPADATIKSRAFALPSSTVMTGLLLAHDLTWYEEDGAIYVMARGQSTEGPSATLRISERTGMVGTPTVMDDGVRVRTLLDHRVRLNTRFSLESVVVDSGDYHVVSYEHRGDNRGGGWYTDIEGRPVE